jgi:TAG lipase/steryl ester hydrolase/phospholipase A2/LPA acyltransferase
VDGASADSPEASSSRLGPGLGEARAADAHAASTSGRDSPLPHSEDAVGDGASPRRENAPSSAASLRRRARRVSDSEAAFATPRDPQVAPRSPRSRRRGAQSLDRGSRAADESGDDSGSDYKSSARVSSLFRSRVSSFHNLLQDSVAGRMSLRVAAQRVSAEIEARMGKFGPGGVEIYRFAWERFNRAVFFHIVFYSSLGCVLGVSAAALAFRLWTQIGHFVLRRLAYVVASLFVLAMLPPSFPNAAAHFLSLVLVGAELVLVGVNLVLFALVHLAVWLNKYILPHWFHGARSALAEMASGVVDHAGRAAAVAARERRDAVAALENAETYDEYKKHAEVLDAFPADLGEGGLAWREDADGGASGGAYDAALVRMYASVCREAREAGDAGALGLALRTVLHRNFAGVDRVSRLRHARLGTKKSAEAFIEELAASVAFLGAAGADATRAARSSRDSSSMDSSDCSPVTEAKNAKNARIESLERVSVEVKETLRLVSETHRSLGRTALCLSGGGALAMYHFGVIKTLLEQGLLPQVISGTSGGSIVAAFVSMFPEEVLLKTIRADLSSRHGVRWFPPVWKMALHFAKKGVLMDGADFAETTRKYFGDVTFAEAFAVSKRAVSIQVSVGTGHGFVLNHFTAPQVVVRTAVNASCALPGLMEPFELLAKNPKTGALAPFHPPGVSSFDGTITADIPSARLTELFNCNNFVVSQVNPHVNFVLHLAEEGRGRRTSRARSGDRRAAVTKLLRVANFLLLNIKYGVQKLLEVDLLNLRMVRTLQGILVQDFRGHVTVLPELRARDYARVLQHPSEEDMANFVRGGERAAWPHVEAIRASTAAEIALTEAATALRGRAREIDERLRVLRATKTGEQQREEKGEDTYGDRSESNDGVGVGATARAPRSAADDSRVTQSDSATDRDVSSGEDDAHLGAGLSCAVESAAWH